MSCLFFKSSVSFKLFIQLMLLLPSVQQTTPQLSDCKTTMNAWKAQLSPEAENKNYRILVKYNTPGVGDNSKTVESLAFYLLRSNNSFNCAEPPIKPIYRVRSVSKANFCTRDTCEFYFDNLTSGYYCIQMGLNLSGGNQCQTIHSHKLINMTIEGFADETVTLYVPPSHKAKVWIVVGTLSIVGVVLAFALEKTYKRRVRPYASVPVVEKRELCLIESRILSGELLAMEVTGRLLVLYAYESQAHFLLVKQFVDLLRKTLPNWEFIIDQEHENDICTLGSVRWVEDNISKVDRVILISSEGSFRQTRLNPDFNVLVGNADINYVFAVAWNSLLNDAKLRGNYAKVFNIRFECTRPEFTLTSVVPNRSFLIPTDYVDLIDHILGCNSWADVFCKDLKGTLVHMEPYLLFVNAVERLAREEGLSHGLGSQDFCWVRPGL